MLAWFAETTLVASVLALVAVLAGRGLRLGPVARHALWLVVLVKLVAPPIVRWPRPAWLARPAVVQTAPARPVLVSVDRAEVQSAALPIREVARPRPKAVPSPAWPGPAAIGRGVLFAWAGVSLMLALGQATRICRFRSRLRWAAPAPEWIGDEARRIARRLRVRAPEILVVSHLHTPMLWFLGRPKLLLPGSLVHSLGVEAWRGILAHELAHVRRRDHWVRRLELAAGLLWWWNPLYWLTRRRLEAEAELACDEVAVRAFPSGRFAFAEALLDVCQSLSLDRPSAAPALGVAGSGRFLERRISMILRDESPARATRPVLFGALALALLALPGWSVVDAASPPANEATDSASASSFSFNLVLDAQDDDEADADEPKAAKRAKREAARAKKALKKKANDEKSGENADEEAMDGEIEVEVDLGDEADVDDALSGLSELLGELDIQIDPAMIEKLAAMGAEIGKEFEKEMGQGGAFQELVQELSGLGEELGKELDNELGEGSDFQKEMEKLGPVLEKTMKALGETLEKKLGPGSDFEKKITEKLGPGSDFERKITEKLGPGSDFEKQMKEKLGPGSDFEEKINKKFGPGSDFEKSMKKLAAEAEAAAGKDKPGSTKESKPARTKKKATAEGSDKKEREKTRRIEELQEQINQLSQELERLRDQEDDEPK